MIVHANVKQGTEEWLRLRIGKPTASSADRLLTPAKRKPSESRHQYRLETLTEWLLGVPLDHGSTGWMDRGSQMEAEARNWYSFERDVEVQQVGFIERDDGLCGASPDGLVGDDGLTEIKCLSAVNHVRALISDANEHHGQVQFQMMIAERAWTDLIFYNPVLPPVVRRIERDDLYIHALKPVLEQFIAELEIDKSRLWKHKVGGPALEYAPFTELEADQFDNDVTAAALAERITKSDAINARAFCVVGRWREARRIWERCR